MNAEILRNIELIDKSSESFYTGACKKNARAKSTYAMERSESEKQFIQLITDHQGKIFAYIYSQTANPEAANEILQETCLVLWNKREQFEMGTNFNAWSQSIAYFQIKAYRQKQYRDRLVFDDDINERIKNTADSIEEKRDIRKEKLNKCISLLQDKYQNYVHKRYRDGMAVNEIADQENIPVNTITQAFFRIRQKLTECVKKVGA